MLLAQGCLHTPHLVSSAWREANLRAGASIGAQGPPVVDWSGVRHGPSGCLDGASPASHPPARYLPDLDRVEVLSLCAEPLHVLLVHEFLHAIRERARRERGYFLEGADPGEESWAQERSNGI